MFRYLRKLWFRNAGLTARIDRGQTYFTAKELYEGQRVDIEAGLYNIRPTKGEDMKIVCPSGDYRIRKYNRMWVVEDA